MNSTSKVIVTVLLIIGFFIIGILFLTSGASKTFVGLFALGLFLGIRAMWKKPKEEEKTEEIKLDKSQDSTEHHAHK
ncbi:MAG: hypothetical protein ACTSUC_04210 [Promethearchaeota archaeon]